MTTRRRVAAVALAAMLASCTPDGADEAGDAAGGDALTPTYSPAGTATDGEGGEGSAGTTGATTTMSIAAGEAPVPGTTGGNPTTAEVAPAEDGGTGAPAPGPAQVPALDPATTSAMTDPVGDPTPSTALAPRPSWADLAGGALSIEGDTVELRVRLADQAPTAAPDGAHTMNVASFYDVDGDGSIDYEVWVNLADTGWGPAHFDNVDGGARFGDESAVTVEVVADELVLRFPIGHVAGARQLRWSLASEWGRYEAIGTPAMARDDAPDEDQAVSHPS